MCDYMCAHKGEGKVLPGKHKGGRKGLKVDVCIREMPGIVEFTELIYHLGCGPEEKVPCGRILLQLLTPY